MPLALVLGAWFAFITFLGARGALVTPPGEPPLPILAAVAAPLVAFFLLLRLSARFRAFALGLDLRLISSMQAWRFAGFGFIALYANGVLPGIFAWPAGLGDMAIALAAPWMVMALISRPQFAASRSYAVWNYLGILDLVVAVSAGAIGSGMFPGLIGDATTAPMASLPLAYVPAFLVPIMIMLHTSALLRSGARTAPSGHGLPFGPSGNGA